MNKINEKQFQQENRQENRQIEIDQLVTVGISLKFKLKKKIIIVKINI